MKFFTHRNFRNFKSSNGVLFRKEVKNEVFVKKVKSPKHACFLKRTLNEVLKLLKFLRGINFIGGYEG